jgi:hypothetical protein
MKLFRTAPLAICIALAGAAFSPLALADDWNRKTVITFSAPVEIPGVHLVGFKVLPAGTYVFRVFDSKSDRHVVQILSKDELTVYATILAIPNYRLKPTDKTVMTFRERPAGQPEALRAWFYPCRNWGEEFVYGKAMAMELAKTENAPVLFTQAEIPVEVAQPITSVTEPVVATLVQAPIMAITPAGVEVQAAEVVTAPPQAELAVLSNPAVTPFVDTLPATAGNVPMIGLFGLLALGGAIAAGFAKRRAI